MTEYKVVWSIELDADNPTDAARLAREIQTDPESIATVFVVTDPDGQPKTVDLYRLERR